jgi:hypothetical protein
MQQSNSSLRSPTKLLMPAITFALITTFGALVQAQGVPSVMPYQGFLSDGTGAPVTGAVSITFKLYEELLSNEYIWEESIDNVSVSAGAFAVNLGASSANLRDYVYTGRAQYVGVSIDGGPELSPRTQLGALPYAFLAYNASRLEGRAAADFVTQAEFAIFQNTVTGGLSADEVNALIDARSYLNADGVNALIDTRGYLNAAAITNLVNSLIDQRGYLTGDEINALINTATTAINIRIDGLQGDITTLQTDVTTLQAQVTTLLTTVQGLQNQGSSAPFILGLSANASSGHFQNGNHQGIRGAGALCQASYPNDATAHYCSMGEVQGALSLGNHDATIDGVETWMFSKWFKDNGADNGFCHSFLYGSAHIGVTGSTMTIDLAVAGGANGTGTRMTFNDSRNCGTAFKILCCR